MSRAVAELTVEELRVLIGDLIEEKLLELLRDPDEGLALKRRMQDRLTAQLQATAGGERGLDFEAVCEELGLR